VKNRTPQSGIPCSRRSRLKLQLQAPSQVTFTNDEICVNMYFRNRCSPGDLRSHTREQTDETQIYVPGDMGPHVDRAHLMEGNILTEEWRIAGIHIQENYLRLGQSSRGDPNGLGPIPPKGGVREEWPNLAYVRAFSASSCTGGAANRPGLSPEVCKGAPKWQFSSVTQGTYNLTNNTVLVTEGEGFAGTMTKARFTKTTILANNTVAGGRNCISVSLVSNIAMVSTSSRKTRFSISGLRGSSFNSGEIPLFADASQCLKTPPVPGLGAGSVGEIRPIYEILVQLLIYNHSEGG
jgi:hypothetical protein